MRPRAPEAYELSKFRPLGKRNEGPFMRGITLPHSEARSLLRLLGEAGVKSSIHPAYGGEVVDVH